MHPYLQDISLKRHVFLPHKQSKQTTDTRLKLQSTKSLFQPVKSHNPSAWHFHASDSRRIPKTQAMKTVSMLTYVYCYITNTVEQRTWKDESKSILPAIE